MPVSIRLFAPVEEIERLPLSLLAVTSQATREHVRPKIGVAVPLAMLGVIFYNWTGFARDITSPNSKQAHLKRL